MHSFRKLVLPAFAGFWCFVFTVPQSLAEPLTQEQLDAFLEELKAIGEVVEGKRVSTRTSAVEAFREASTSDKAALEFYLKCVKMLRFDSRDAKYTEYRDWRDRNEDKMEEESNLLAMRLQLQYLVMTLRVAEGVDREAIIPELETFITNIVANVEDLEGRGMQTLREEVNRTVFAEAYELNQSLQVENWNYAPGNYAACYEETIFPYFRSEAPEGLADAWDRRIGLEKQYVGITKEDDEVALEKFVSERLPRLYWQKASDLFQSVSQQQGILAMMQILRTHSDHPDATKWLKDLQGLLTAAAEAIPSFPGQSDR